MNSFHVSPNVFDFNVAIGFWNKHSEASTDEHLAHISMMWGPWQDATAIFTDTNEFRSCVHACQNDQNDQNDQNERGPMFDSKC